MIEKKMCYYNTSCRSICAIAIKRFCHKSDSYLKKCLKINTFRNSSRWFDKIGTYLLNILSKRILVRILSHKTTYNFTMVKNLNSNYQSRS